VLLASLFFFHIASISMHRIVVCRWWGLSRTGTNLCWLAPVATSSYILFLSCYIVAILSGKNSNLIEFFPDTIIHIMREMDNIKEMDKMDDFDDYEVDDLLKERK